MSSLGVVDIAKELIRFDTQGDLSQGILTKELPCAKWIKDFLEDLGMEAELQEVAPERANVIAKIGEGEGPGLVLSGHMDVVLAGDLNLWTVTGPFEPLVKEGKLYGRGACDMKGPDACMLQAAKDLSKEDFKRQLTLVFTSGEDTGGWYVTKVLEEKKVTPDDAKYGLVGEPTVMTIVRGHKGSGGCRVVFKGRAAHSSRPELGINAIMKAADFLEHFKELKADLLKVKDPLLGPSTCSATIIKGGFKGNIIPDECVLTINMRLIPQHANVEVIGPMLQKILNNCAAADKDFKAEIEGLRCSHPLYVPEDNEFVQLLVDILKTQPRGEPYYTEAVNYTQAGIPTVLCGPGDIAQAHTPNEYISLEQLNEGVRVYKEIIKKVCL